MFTYCWIVYWDTRIVFVAVAELEGEMNRPIIAITQRMYERAYEEAKRRAPFTSRRHDYHDGSYKARRDKYIGGCLGEEVFKEWLRANDIWFRIEVRNPEEADRADIWLPDGNTVNVKTELPGRKRFANTLLVTMEETEKRPCDFYVAVLLEKWTDRIYLAGMIAGFVHLSELRNFPVVDGFEKNYAVPYAGLKVGPESDCLWGAWHQISSSKLGVR